MKSRGIFGNNYNGDDQLALTHPEDLSAAIGKELQAEGNGVQVKYIVSDASTGNKIADLFGQAIGKPELTWTTISDEQLKQGMLSGGLSSELIGLITEKGQGVRAGIITKDFYSTGGKVTGLIKLEQFVKEFKAVYLRD